MKHKSLETFLKLSTNNHCLDTNVFPFLSNMETSLNLPRFLAKGTRLEALFRFSVMWHLTREIQGSRVTSHNRSFDRYFHFHLHFYIELYRALFSFLRGGGVLCRENKKMSKRKIFHFLGVYLCRALCACCGFLGEGSCCKNRKSFINEE